METAFSFIHNLTHTFHFSIVRLTDAAVQDHHCSPDAARFGRSRY